MDHPSILLLADSARQGPSDLEPLVAALGYVVRRAPDRAPDRASDPASDRASDPASGPASGLVPGLGGGSGPDGGAESLGATSREPVSANPSPPAPLVYEASAGAPDRALGELVRILERRERPVVLVHAEADAPEPSDWGLDAVVPLARPVSSQALGLALALARARHAAARSARETEDRFFASALDMLCLLDFSGMFKRLNPAWETTLGFTLEELQSKPFIEFVHPDDRERTLAQNARVRGGERALAFENRYLCKDGGYRWFRWNATPDTRWPVIYSVARDITREKQAQEEREALVRELQAALAEVRELRTILPICSYCRKVRDDRDFWHTVETYFAHHTETRFSHGICPDCLTSEVNPHFETLDG